MKVKQFILSFALPAFVLCDVFNPDTASLPDSSKLSKFTPDHLAQAKRLSSFDLSPNKGWAVFAQSQFNKTDNKSGSNLRIVNLSTNAASDLIPYKYGQGDSGPVWMDDSTVGFAAVRGSPASNLFTISVSDKTITQVTNYTNDIGGVVYSAAAKRIAFTSFVYEGMTMDESAEETERIADLPSSGVVHDKLFVRHWDTWITKGRNQLFTVSIAGSNGKFATAGEPVNLVAKYTGEWGLEPDFYTFSADGAIVLFSAKIQGREEAWQTEAGIFTVPADGSAAPTRLNSNFKGAASSPAISPDGKTIVWLQMSTPGYESDQNQVIMYDTATKTQTRVLSDIIYSPGSVTFSEDGSSLYLVIPTEKDVPLFKYDIASKKLTRLTGDGTVADFREVSNSQILASMSTLQYPNTLYTLNTSGDLKQIKITTENDAFFSSLYFSPTDYFWFNGALDEKVQALVLYPYGFDKTKKYPVACVVHGGPQSSWNDGWSNRWNPNIFANQGFVVIIINFHGGDAYGQKFTDSIQHNWGTYPYQDIMKGMDAFLANASYADEKKTVALGASYGGYMMNWINGHTDRFNAIVNHDGVFSTVSMGYATEELYFNEHDIGVPFDPAQRPLVEEFNPERFVANWKTPTLIIHSELDFRVPLTEGISAFTALQRQGIESKFLYFPDENHWILKPQNSLKWHDEVLGWIGKYSNVTVWTDKW